MALYLRQEELVQWLHTQHLPAERTSLAEFATHAALVAYRGRVALDYRYADYRGIGGIMQAEHAVSLPLDDVYIVPHLHPERAQADTRAQEQRLLHMLLDTSDLPREERVQLEAEYAVLTGERWRPGEPAKEDGVPLSVGLAQTRHAVILGGPGIGKSALVRFLARACALGGEAMQERLGWGEALTPVVLSLAAFADACRDRPTLSLRTYFDEHVTARVGAALCAALAQELTAGQVFVLLDGVDEMPDVATRSAVVRAVEQFLIDHAANRCLVTSRPYGYVRLAGDLAHFQLPNFSPTQIERFVHQWQRAFEDWQHPDAPDRGRADTAAIGMLQEIRSNPKVAELATNPLMLVIISLIRLERARLPEQRVQLYNRAIDTLMDTWNYWRSLARLDVGGTRLPLDRLIRVWGAVAEWTRRTKPTGVVHRAELERKLIEVLRDKEFDEEDPHATAESYLNAAADRAGLLEERGRDIFAFWHPTFEEFLAAVELATPPATAIARLLPLRDDSRWREVILLAVGYVGIVQRDGETATALVKALAYDDPSPLEPVLYPHLRLAAACVADDVGVKRSLAQELIVQLAHVIQRQPYKPLTTTFVRIVRALPRLRPAADTLAAIPVLLEHKDWEVRMEAARLLSNVVTDHPYARTLCERLLKDSNSDVCCHAALGLARAGDYRPAVWQALARFRSSSAHIEPAVREFFTTPPDEAVAVLLSCLTADDPGLRVRAAEVLHEMGRADERVVDALLSCLTADDATLRMDAAEVLHRMGRADERVVEVLAKRVLQRPWAILTACQKVIHQQPLLQEDGNALGELVRMRDEDSMEQREVRSVLFTWLQGMLEPTEQRVQ